MKKSSIFNNLVLILILLGISIFVIRTCTKKQSQNITNYLSIKDLDVYVKYNSPIKHNNKIFGDQVPFGIVWRTGANEATIISFSKNCLFGGQYVKKGDYSLWTIPEKNTWTVILNKETGQWGTNYNGQKNYLEIKTPVKHTQENLEDLEIELENEAKEMLLNIAWENTLISVKIKPIDK